MKVAQRKMKGINGKILPRSQLPPTLMAQTVAKNTS
jgi:hypothetical protein